MSNRCLTSREFQLHDKVSLSIADNDFRLLHDDWNFVIKKRRFNSNGDRLIHLFLEVGDG
jgi:hypothetical protein